MSVPAYEWQLPLSAWRRQGGPRRVGELLDKVHIQGDVHCCFGGDTAMFSLRALLAYLCPTRYLDGGPEWSGAAAAFYEDAYRSEGKRIDFSLGSDKRGDKMENKNVRMPNVLRAKVREIGIFLSLDIA